MGTLPLFNKKLLALAIAVNVSSMAMAQDTSTQQSEVAQQSDAVLMDEIVVTASYSESLKRALDLKRDSNDFVDSIQAEDVGKFPEVNLAEAMQRIPGIQIVRDSRGQGSKVTMRGLGSGFLVTQLNGASIGGREFDYGMFPTEMFSAAEVWKSSRASNIEGGVAGTTLLKTAHPFDFDEPVLHYSLEQTYSDASEKSNPKGSFFISNTWNDTFGALLTVSNSAYEYQSENVKPDGWTRGRVVDYDDDLVRTGNTSFTFDTSQGNESGLSDEQLANTFFPSRTSSNIYEGKDERTSAYAAFQWRPNDDLDLNLEVIHTEKKEVGTEAQMRFRFDGTGPGEVVSANKGYLKVYDVVTDGDQAISGIANGTVFRSWSKRFERDITFDQISFNGTWQMREDIKVSWMLANNKLKTEEESVSGSLDSVQTAVAFELDSSLVSVTPGIDLTDASQFTIIDMEITPIDKQEDNNNIFKFDLTFGDDDNNIRTGVMYHSLERDRIAYSWRDSDDVLPLLGRTEAILDELSVTDFTRVLGTSFGGNLSDDPGYSRWVGLDFDAFGREGFFGSDILGAAPLYFDRLNTITEETISAYIETNRIFEVMDYEVYFNAGVRYIGTQVDTKTAVQDTTTSTINDVYYAKEEINYSGVVPSMTATLHLREDLIVKMAIAKTMTRPNPDDLASKIQVDQDADVSKGNPDLEPYYSKQFDIGIEWYFDEASVLALGYFYKDISGWIEKRTTQQPFIDAGIAWENLTGTQQASLNNDSTMSTIVDFKTKVNGEEDIVVEGIELVYQQPLPFILEGFGVEFNVSKLNYQGDRTIEGFSEWSSNLVTYYERGNFQTRLSYNYRDAYATCVVECIDGTTLGRFTEAAGYLNYSANYLLPESFTIGKEMRISFSVNNLTNEVTETYLGASDQWLTSNQYNGRNFTLGLSGSF